MKTLFAIACALVLMTAHSARAEDPVEGTVSEVGYGKFKVIDKDKVTRLFNESKAETKYEPAEWRPAVGDIVNVSYTPVEQKVRVDVLKLVKAGPDTVIIRSPVEVEISEVGRTAFKGKVPTQDNREVKFLKTRETRFVPNGWVPSPGEKARIEFTTKSAMISFGINYVIEKIEKIATFSPAPESAPVAEKAK